MTLHLKGINSRKILNYLYNTCYTHLLIWLAQLSELQVKLYGTVSTCQL